MKVLHFYKTFTPDTYGGIEKVIDQIAISTAEFDVETEVLSLTPEKNESTMEINGYQVHRVPQTFEMASTPFSTKIFSRFKALAERADIIHYHFPFPFADIVHFATRIKKPTLITYHSDIVKQKILLQFYKPLMYAFLSDMTYIIATSPNYVKTSPVLSRFSDKIKMIPYGLDKSSYPKPNLERLNYWRNRFNQKFFLFIGVMRYYKSIDILLEAAKNLDAPIVIIGSGDIIPHKKLPNVHFIGEISEEDKVALLTLCYGVVLPSHLRSEAFGIFLLEGAMYGKPMICCDIGTGTTFINIHQETGLVVPPCDSNALRLAMQYLLEHPDEALRMGNNAHKRYERCFTADIMAKAYFEIYDSLRKA